jgi:hypothetical protein
MQQQNTTKQDFGESSLLFSRLCMDQVTGFLKASNDLCDGVWVCQIALTQLLLGTVWARWKLGHWCKGRLMSHKGQSSRRKKAQLPLGRSHLQTTIVDTNSGHGWTGFAAKSASITYGTCGSEFAQLTPHRPSSALEQSGLWLTD